MSFKLTKQEATDLMARHVTLVAREAALQHALDQYNKAIAATQTFAASVAERLRAEFDDKGDRWQRSEYGVTVNEFICEWENLVADMDATDVPLMSSSFATLPIEAERPLCVRDLERIVDHVIRRPLSTETLA
jgi:hypothetical protein